VDSPSIKIPEGKKERKKNVTFVIIIIISVHEPFSVWGGGRRKEGKKEGELFPSFIPSCAKLRSYQLIIIISYILFIYLFIYTCPNLASSKAERIAFRQGDK